MKKYSKKGRLYDDVRQRAYELAKAMRNPPSRNPDEKAKDAVPFQGEKAADVKLQKMPLYSSPKKEEESEKRVYKVRKLNDSPSLKKVSFSPERDEIIKSDEDEELPGQDKKYKNSKHVCKERIVANLLQNMVKLVKQEEAKKEAAGNAEADNLKVKKPESLSPKKRRSPKRITMPDRWKDT